MRGSTTRSPIEVGRQKLARSEQTLARARAQLLRSQTLLRRIAVRLELMEQRLANAASRARFAARTVDPDQPARGADVV